MDIREECFRWLFDETLILASVIDADGRVVEVSVALAARLGFSREELSGQALLDLVTPASAQRIEREYRPLLRRTGRLDQVAVGFVTRRGETVELLSSSTMQAGNNGRIARTFAVYSEVGDLARMERRMIELYRATPAMLHALDAQARVVEVSERWLAKMGYRREDVVGRPVTDFLSPATLERLDKGRLKRLFHVEELTNHPRELVTRSGEILEVLMSAVAERDAQGNVVRLFVASKDITARNRSERLLREAFAENAQLRRELQLERDYLREEVNVSMNFGHIVGSSPILQGLLSRIDAVAQTPASVLIAGESGTGKELVAHAIHSRSPRADAPLVKVNCASVPDELFESEFFGHVKGAFTGAYKNRIGRFQLADGGTIFLDEVSEIPLELQGKLLRVLQEKQFEQVGDDRTLSVDVRVIAASNRNLQAEVEAGRFREDLFYRLSVFPVEVPPLRERGDDVVQLAVHFLDRICKEFGRNPFTLTQGQVERLKSYRWPGNVRELKNVLERAVILSSGEALRLDLPDDRSAREVAPETVLPAVSDAAGGILTDAQMRMRDRDNLLAALEQTGWRMSGPDGAAALLGLKPSTLSGRLKSLGIEKPALQRGRPRRRA